MGLTRRRFLQTAGLVLAASSGGLFSERIARSDPGGVKGHHHTTTTPTTTTVPTTTAPPPPPGPNPVPPPSSGCYFGAYIEGAQTYGYYYPAGAPWGNAPWTGAGYSDPWPQFETDAGKKVAMLMFGQSQFFSNPNFDYDGNFAATVARGAIPVVDAVTSELGWTLAEIAAGAHDAPIRNTAQGAAAYGHPFVLRVDAEMNGGWYPFGAEIRASGNGPATFIAAWRRIHDIFAAAGASNVSWHWCPNVDPESIQTPFEQLYPGDDYVDWTGMTGYNHGGEAFDWVFGSTYARLLALAPSKPIMIGELGSVDAGYPGEKVAFINTLFSELQGALSQVKAFCWFNWYILENGREWDWPIESGLQTGSGSLAAFQSGVASPYIVGR